MSAPLIMLDVRLKFAETYTFEDPEEEPGGAPTRVTLPAGTIVRAKGRMLSGTWYTGPAVSGIARPSSHGGGVHVRCFDVERGQWFNGIVDCMCL